MIDLECMIKSLRLAWLKRIFSSNRGTWKWTGLRYLVPNYLKYNMITATPSTTSPLLTIDNQVFDVMEKKSKQYYSLLIGKKAQLPSAAGKLQKDFNFSGS